MKRLLGCCCGCMTGLLLIAGTPVGLMTEYRESPFGLGTAVPRLSWRLPEGTRAQTAYEIEADGRSYGKVVSDAQMGIAYPGVLSSRARVNWRVRTWDENGKASDWSEKATFSVANLSESDWGGAKWIGTADAQPPAFVKRFTVKGPVAKATLAVSAAGFYEATLNGARIGDKLLDPGFFDYDKRMLFSAYPLEGQLKEGENELKVLLGHAWYDVRSHAAWDFDTARWRDRPKFILNLDILYKDGTCETVVTDDSWTTAPSPIAYDDIRDGEFIDMVGGDHRAPRANGKANVVEPPKGALVAASHPATCAKAEIAPVKIWRCDDGRVVVDFGVNIAGWMRMKLRGIPKGRVITFRYDERIQKDGLPALPKATYLRGDGPRGMGISRRTDEHLSVPGARELLGEDYWGFQTDRYTATGADEETYEPRFTYNGFQYVVITGLDKVPDVDDLTAVEIGTDFRKTGSFRCSDETFNKLIEATDRSYRGNFTVGVPTDCPHREKNGWTGDAQIASELAQYYYENTASYEKWIRDIVDAQDPSGDIPGIVPTASWGFKWGNGPGWDAALTVIPWNVYCYRGDVRILEEAYPAIRRYLAFTKRKSDGGLVSHGLGDWCPVNSTHMPTLEYSSSLYYYQAQTLAARIATVLKRPVDAARYAAGAAKTRAAIVAKYYHGEGTWDNGHQTAQAMALGFGIVPEGEVKATEDKLVASVLREGGQADFGIFGSKTVFRALSNAGRADLAFPLAAGRSDNQFGTWIKHGATTLWEHFRGTSSLNHIMFGDFAAWACQCLAGIRLAPSKDWADMIPAPTKPAFKEMLIAPMPIEALTFAEADILTPYGRVFSRWDRDGKTVRYRVTLPPGTTARFRAPGIAETAIGPGEHAFSFTDDPAKYAYHDASLPTAARVADLLSHMTIEEKFAQLGKFRAFHTYDRKDGRIVPQPDAVAGIMTNCPGTVYGLLRADWWSGRNWQTGVTPEMAVRAFNDYQRIAVEKTRLGIPMFFVEEGPHGLMALGEPVYPTGLGLGSTFDADLMRRIGRQIGSARAHGVHSVYAPILDLARDPRWSRCEECFGEDPELVSVLGLAEFEGLKEAGLEPCLKHYVGGGNAEGGHNTASAHLGLMELYNMQLRPFRRCIAAGAHHLMSTYHDVDGEPCNGSRFLLTDVLREQLGFDGFVTADGGAIQLLKWRGIATDFPEAAAQALKAGCDGESGSATSAACGSVIRKAFEAGLLTSADLDRAVGRLLKIKFDMGLFECPYGRESKDEVEEGRSLSLEAARKSLVLLENRGVLPLKKGPSVAVIGPNADDKIMNQLGDYTAPQRRDDVVTVLDGIKTFAEKVTYAKGCGIRSMKKDGFAEAEKLASEADVTVLVLGGSSSPYAGVKQDDALGGATVVTGNEDEENDKDSGEGTDRSTLGYSGVQEDLFRAVRAKAKKLVVVLVQGRPLAVDEIAAKADAVLLAWYPGSLGGQAVAEALYGAVNPSGRLPVAIPHSVGQIPICSDGYAAKRPRYIDGPGDAAYPFGYGLSYTTFAYSDFSVSALDAQPADDAAFVTVANTGTCDGDEIVRLYFTVTGSGRQRPNRELLAFARVSLKAGESKRVSLPFDRKLFGQYGRDGKYESPRGKVDLRIDGCEGMVTFVYDRAGVAISSVYGVVESSRDKNGREGFGYGVLGNPNGRGASVLAPFAAGEKFAVCAVNMDSPSVGTIVADLRVAAKMQEKGEVFAVAPAELAAKRPNRVLVICEPDEEIAAAFADELADTTDEMVLAPRRDALLAYQRKLVELEKSVADAGAKIVYMTPPCAFRLRGLDACARIVRTRAERAKAECIEAMAPLSLMDKRETAHAFRSGGVLTPLGARLVSAYVLDALDKAAPGTLKAKDGVRFAEDAVTRELDKIYPFTRRFNEGRRFEEGM